MVWLGMHCAIPVEAKLLTWECTTTFDEIPALETLESLFESEFPRTCRRLQESGGFYRIWHLVSFNSSEGRRSRFLVALVEKPFEKRKFENIRRRALPEQIWLSAAADQMIRALPESDNAGNYLCYGYAENTLCILVFFEGRLCHWSEESFAENCSRATLDARMEQAVSRFRRFLESDALFSRAKHFEEINLLENVESDFSLALFKRASRDSFWRGCDLRKPEGNATKDFTAFAGAMLGRRTFWLVILALVLLLGKYWNLGEKLNRDSLLNLNDVVPPELSMPEISLQEVAAEETSAEKPREISVPRERKQQCVLPELFLKGVVGETFAVVAVAGESREVLTGDSLGPFEVRTVGRDQIVLACGDSSIVKKVGSHGF